jgi:hypothetical protein
MNTSERPHEDNNFDYYVTALPPPDAAPVLPTIATGFVRWQNEEHAIPTRTHAPELAASTLSPLCPTTREWVPRRGGELRRVETKAACDKHVGAQSWRPPPRPSDRHQSFGDLVDLRHFFK